VLYVAQTEYSVYLNKTAEQIEITTKKPHAAVHCALWSGGVSSEKRKTFRLHIFFPPFPFSNFSSHSQLTHERTNEKQKGNDEKKIRQQQLVNRWEENGKKVTVSTQMIVYTQILAENWQISKYHHHFNLFSFLKPFFSTLKAISLFVARSK
jgi:hypothetical protein